MGKERNYIQGFNDGYLLSLHESQLTEKLIDSIEGHNDYAEGLIKGAEQLQKGKEQVKNDLNELRKLRDKQNPDIDLFPDR